MKKIKLNINDEITLWNGEEGTISEIDKTCHKITITKEHSYPSKIHTMNVKTVNGEYIDSNDIIL